MSHTSENKDITDFSSPAFYPLLQSHRNTTLRALEIAKRELKYNLQTQLLITCRDSGHPIDKLVVHRTLLEEPDYDNLYEVYTEGYLAPHVNTVSPLKPGDELVTVANLTLIKGEALGAFVFHDYDVARNLYTVDIEALVETAETLNTFLLARANS